MFVDSENNLQKKSVLKSFATILFLVIRAKWVAYLIRWSKIHWIVALFCGGSFEKHSFNNSVRRLKLPADWLKAPNNVGYNWSVNNASGSSRKYNFSIPVTEWMSTSFNNCSASYESKYNQFQLKWNTKNSTQMTHLSRMTFSTWKCPKSNQKPDRCPLPTFLVSPLPLYTLWL